ncbi:MAG TPA: amidohydrolase family protein [Calditrichia bacterium]|nr:amidohydrolase family protein [Calditrichia bacterium]
MKRIHNLIFLATALWLIAPGLSGGCFGQIAVLGETVYPIDKAPISNGVVLIKDGKIERVGEAGKVKIPASYRQISAKVVTPGLIDAHSVVGLAGYFNQDHDQDQLDKAAPIQPELRALDAYNPREKLVEWLREHGVTTLHTGHAPGGLITGQSIIVKTVGNTVEEALIDPQGVLTMTLGSQVGRNFKSPGTRAKGMAMLRSEFLAAQAKMKKTDDKEGQKGGRDLKTEALQAALRGEVPVMITAHQATEIMSALRLAKEFGLNMILDGAAEAYLVLDEIRASGVKVIVHPTMTRNYGETANVAFDTAARLKQAGILFAFQSGYESYVPKTRVILFEAAQAVANGLALEDALRALTLDAAQILGLDKRIGSLSAGKDADLVLFDGDPFEYTHHVRTVIIDGRVVSEVQR